MGWTNRGYALTAPVCYGIGIPLGYWALGVRQASGFAIGEPLLAEWLTYEPRRLLMVLARDDPHRTVAGGTRERVDLNDLLQKRR